MSILRSTPFGLIMLLFFACQYITALATPAQIVLDSCKQISKTDPQVSYEFCVKELGSDPEMKFATVQQLGSFSFYKTKLMAASIESKIASLKPNCKHCCADCLSFYKTAISLIKSGSMAYHKRDYETANVDLSAAMDYAGECEDGCKELHESSPVTNEYGQFFQLTGISLAFTSMSG